jgi:hypothetical protein
VPGPVSSRSDTGLCRVLQWRGELVAVDSGKAALAAGSGGYSVDPPAVQALASRPQAMTLDLPPSAFASSALRLVAEAEGSGGSAVDPPAVQA